VGGEPETQEAEVTALYVAAGREVEELAAGLFPGAAAVDEAGSAAALGSPGVWLQPHLVADGLKAIADVVEVQADGLFIWEVKASGYRRSEPEVRALYDWDLAFQVHVARAAGYTVVGAGLVLLDKDYVRGAGPLVASEVLVKVDRTAEIDAMSADVAAAVAEQVAVLAEHAMPDALPGPRCNEGRGNKAGNRPSKCGHQKAHGVCGRELPMFWAGSLPNLGGKKLEQMTATPGLKIEDLDPDDKQAKWTPNQRRIIEAVQARDEVVDAPVLRAALDKIEWPVAYVDFEYDSTMALPRYEGMGPNTAVPFQWAVGVETKSGGGLGEVSSFLDLSDADPSRPFAESLLAALPASGTIVAHHKQAEIGILKGLAARLGGDVGARLLDLIPRFQDTEAIAKSGYYHPDQMSSYSIKPLAPPLTGVAYDGLAISNGMLAVAQWRRARSQTTEPTERDEIRDHLLEYCGQDAELMHLILEELRAKSGWLFS
jgi:hypothetical protein